MSRTKVVNTYQLCVVCTVLRTSSVTELSLKKQEPFQEFIWCSDISARVWTRWWFFF